MISGAKCMDHTKCNVCYSEYPNYHCIRCSFVLCNTCRSVMSRLEIDDKCSQCRMIHPWLKNYETIPEIKQNIYFNNYQCNIKMKNRKCQLHFLRIKFTFD